MRLKKGDEVRSHRDCPFGGFKTGDIFTITAVDGDLIMFVDNDGNSRLRPDDEFELLPVADATGKPALTIETGKFYRTRDGRKVGPIGWNDTYLKELFPFVDTTDISDCWSSGGKFLYPGHPDSDKDLIAEWADAPASNDNQPVAEQHAGATDITIKIGLDTTALEASLDGIIGKLERIRELKVELAA